MPAPQLAFLRRIKFVYVFLFVFVFMGMSALVLGLLEKEWILIIPGGLIAFYAHRPLLSIKPLTVLIVGLLLGTLLGVFAGEAAKLLFGIVAGAFWGAFLGLVLSIPLLAMVIPGFGAGPIKIHILPNIPIIRAILAGIFSLVMLIGGGLGINYLRQGIGGLFGSLGDGILLGWFVGAVIAYALRFNVANMAVAEAKRLQ